MTQRSPAPPDETTCPVSDTLLSHLYRADAPAIRAIALDLPELTRMRLAVYCYTRAHLREIGRQVVAVCDKSSLIQVAGRGLGQCFAEMRVEHMPHVRQAPRVTLATAQDMRRRVSQVTDEDDSEAL